MVDCILTLRKTDDSECRNRDWFCYEICGPSVLGSCILEWLRRKVGSYFVGAREPHALVRHVNEFQSHTEIHLISDRLNALTGLCIEIALLICFTQP